MTTLSGGNFAAKFARNNLSDTLYNRNSHPGKLNTGKQQLTVNERTSIQQKSQTSSNVRRNAEVERMVSRNGNTTVEQNKSKIYTEADIRRQAELNKQSRQTVDGNRKDGPITTESSLKQSTLETVQLKSAETRGETSTTTQNSMKSGNVVATITRTDADREGTSEINTQLDRRTETQVDNSVYDKNGKLINSNTNRTATTVGQTSELTRDWEGESARIAVQKAVTTNSREDGANVQRVNVKSEDMTYSTQTTNTDVKTATTVQVEKLDANGNVLNSKTSTQKVEQEEVVDSQSLRFSKNEQDTVTKSSKGYKETVTHRDYEVDTYTSNESKVTGTVSNFDGDNRLVNERTFERDNISIRDESRKGDSETRSSESRNNGEIISTTGIRANEELDVTTRTISDDNGKKTTRTINTEINNQIAGDITNKTTESGQRVTTIDSKNRTFTNTEDLTIGPDGKTRKVETDTLSVQALEGQMQFNPANSQVTAGQALAPGSVIINMGSISGLRSSFKMDNGVLTFDFTASRSQISETEITSGNVAGMKDGKGNSGSTTTQQIADEDVHFSGKVISSFDEAGNRVISLEASIKSEGLGAALVNEKDGLRIDHSKTDLDIKGSLSVNKQTSGDGKETVSKSQAKAEMSVNKVENKESVNIGNSNPISLSSGIKAGLSADNGALRFNFGSFNFGIEFVA